MGRPTIRDLAEAAGVSVATVNRVLGESGKVRPATSERILEAARDIGFYGAGVIQHRVAAARPRYRLGVVIQTPHRSFTEAVAHGLEGAAAEIEDAEVRLHVEHHADLSPESIAARMQELATESDALAVTAAEHPVVAEAIDRLAAQGVPVVAMVSPLSARANLGYVGLDSWKLGRTAAWACDRMSRSPGKLAVFVGTHRYRCHDLGESGFRSYFREHANDFVVLDALSTFESDAVARELTEKLLRGHADLRGIYVSGGGISGVLAAVRACGKVGEIVTVGHDLMDSTRAGLLDGSLTMALSHPFKALGRETVAALIRAKKAGADATGQSVVVPFEIYTRENI
jgi:LacI family transcriptional regulator